MTEYRIRAFLSLHYLWSSQTSSKIENYQQAILDYTMAISINADYAHAYYNRGLAYLKINKTEYSQADFAKAAELYRLQENQ
jgi:tetratricopeptide (TPR) repeat protein